MGVGDPVLVLAKGQVGQGRGYAVLTLAGGGVGVGDPVLVLVRESSQIPASPGQDQDRVPHPQPGPGAGYPLLHTPGEKTDKLKILPSRHTS